MSFSTEVFNEIHQKKLLEIFAVEPVNAIEILAWTIANPTEINNVFSGEDKYTFGHCIMYSSLSRWQKQFLIYQLKKLNANFAIVDRNQNSVQTLMAGINYKLVFTAEGFERKELSDVEKAHNRKDAEYYIPLAAFLEKPASSTAISPFRFSSKKLADCEELIDHGFYLLAKKLISTEFEISKGEAIVLCNTLLKPARELLSDNKQAWVIVQRLTLIKLALPPKMWKWKRSLFVFLLCFQKYRQQA